MALPNQHLVDQVSKIMGGVLTKAVLKSDPSPPSVTRPANTQSNRLDAPVGGSATIRIRPVKNAWVIDVGSEYTGAEGDTYVVGPHDNLIDTLTSILVTRKVMGLPSV